MVNRSPQPFYGRKQLLSALQQTLTEVRATQAGQMISIRGRRQVGKSRLLTRFVENAEAPYLYFTALKNADTGMQLERFHQDLNESSRPFPDLNLFPSRSSSWAEAFNRVEIAARSEAIIVVFDEFPWAAQADPTLESALQIAWDRKLQHLPVLLFLVGSDVSVMERITQHDRPLFGRASERIVRPFDVAECAEALGTADPMMAFDAHLVTGGYPRLVTACAKFTSALDFAKQQLGDENNDLVIIGQRVLDAEFVEGDIARRVLTAIGGLEIGTASLSRVVGKLSSDPTKYEETATQRALKTLIEEKSIVAVDTPVSSESGRLRRYRIADPYLRFWLRFVAPHNSSIARGRADIARHALTRDWTAWRGRSIEPIIWESLYRFLPSTEMFQNAEQIGGWWNRDNSTEVDIAIANRGASEIVAIGSIKWRERKKFKKSELGELSWIRQVVPRSQHAELLVICPAGVDELALPYIEITPRQLLDAWRIPSEVDDLRKTKTL